MAQDADGGYEAEHDNPDDGESGAKRHRSTAKVAIAVLGLAVFGSVRFAQNREIEGTYYNRDLLMNTIGWLIGQSDLVSIRPRGVRACKHRGETIARSGHWDRQNADDLGIDRARMMASPQAPATHHAVPWPHAGPRKQPTAPVRAKREPISES